MNGSSPTWRARGINWQVTAEDGSWPSVEPLIRVDRVAGVERISYDQVILKVSPPVTGNFQVSAFSMADWAFKRQCDWKQRRVWDGRGFDTSGHRDARG